MKFMSYGALCAAFLAASLSVSVPAQAGAEGAKSLAMLHVYFFNDNEDLEPTDSEERARMAALEKQFKSMLEESGRYRFVAVSAETRAKVAGGQQLGRCAGCELDYGKELGADQVAWVEVQKVSNLIMNMNVYISDVAAKKSVFVHSVDIRGNTDQSWSRSLRYLLKNYLLDAPGQ